MNLLTKHTGMIGSGRLEYDKSRESLDMVKHELEPILHRIADALDRLAPSTNKKHSFDGADAFVWHANPEMLEPVNNVNKVDLNLLLGIDQQINTLHKNTLNFARGFAANNALLWGARGTGKSSLVKAIHAEINETLSVKLALIEIHREDIPTLPRLLQVLSGTDRRCILFCDDLSFEMEDATFKSLKAVLEGGIEGRPENIIFYATSNRRHLMPRDMIENERSNAIHTAEAVEEKVSLSDRFGLWLGFHPLKQETFFQIIDGYVEQYGLKIKREELHAEALEWSMTRGSRSGRVAFQYIQDLAGRLGKNIN
jgi:hypothetical protein